MSELPVEHMYRKEGYVFDPKDLHEAAKKAIGLPHEAAFQTIIQTLDERYPGKINTQLDWVFNNAGGAMGQMSFLYGSIKEYLIIFGTSRPTEGHSGRYRAEVFDFGFKGEWWCEYEGVFEPEIHGPGDIAYLSKSMAKHYGIEKEAWMIEYARGNIPSMIPFGFADSLVSTVDLPTVVKGLKTYTRLTMKSMFGKWLPKSK